MGGKGFGTFRVCADQIADQERFRREENGSGGTSVVLLGVLDFVVVSAVRWAPRWSCWSRRQAPRRGACVAACWPARPAAGRCWAGICRSAAGRPCWAGCNGGGAAWNRAARSAPGQRPIADPIAGAADRAGPGRGDAAGGGWHTVMGAVGAYGDPLVEDRPAATGCAGSEATSPSDSTPGPGAAPALPPASPT